MEPTVYSCSFPNCSHSYRTQQKLEKHQKLHKSKELLTVKDLICDVCERVLTTKQSLSEHLLTHRNKKAFRCSEVGCGKRFKQYSQLCNHRKMHRMAKCGLVSGFYMKKDLPAVEISFNLSEDVEERGSNQCVELPAITKPVFGVILPSFESIFK